MTLSSVTDASYQRFRVLNIRPIPQSEEKETSRDTPTETVVPCYGGVVLFPFLVERPQLRIHFLTRFSRRTVMCGCCEERDGLVAFPGRIERIGDEECRAVGKGGV